MGSATAQTLLQEKFDDTRYAATWKLTDRVERALWLGVSGSGYLRFHPRFQQQVIETPVLFIPAGNYRLAFAWNRARTDGSDSVQVQLLDAGIWKTIHLVGSGNDRQWQTDTVTFVTSQDSFSLRWRYFSPGKFPAQYFNIDDVRVEKALTTSIPVRQNELDFSVFPNPGDGLFQLTMDNPFLQPVVLEIYNAAGSRVYEINLPRQQQISMPLDLRAFSKGHYYLRFRTLMNSIAKKILIQ